MARIVPATTDLNQTRLAELLEAEANLDAGDGARVLQTVLDIIGRHASAGYRVKLTNFGTFESYDRKVCQHGLPAKRAEGATWPTTTRVIRFKASGLLADYTRSAKPIVTLKKRPKNARIPY